MLKDRNHNKLRDLNFIYIIKVIILIIYNKHLNYLLYFLIEISWNVGFLCQEENI